MLISFAIHKMHMMTLGMVCALALMMMWMGEIGNNSDDDDIYDGKIKGILDAISGTITDTESTLGNGTEIINNKSYKVQYNE